MIKKCIVLFSGGLDSRLAVKIMQAKEFQINALYFKLPFSKDIEHEIRNFCKKNKTELKVFDCTKGKLFVEYLNVIRKPKFGTGTAMNPCIDCRIFILKKAKEFADKKRIKLIVTGEVLGQRPMSQTKKAMEIIDKKIRFKLARPLTELGISGRNRKQQLALAKKFKIDFPSPGGGCLLCETLYCKKLKLILFKKNLKFKDIFLLKIGRHFESSNIILGRNEKENNVLEKTKGLKVVPQQAGPTALIKEKKYVNEAKKLIQGYSKNRIKNFDIR